MIFSKRFSDVFEDEEKKFAEEIGNEQRAKELVEKDDSLLWFYLHFEVIGSQIIKQITNLGKYLIS